MQLVCYELDLVPNARKNKEVKRMSWKELLTKSKGFFSYEFFFLNPFIFFTQPRKLPPL